jgi:hypothetical protein
MGRLVLAGYFILITVGVPMTGEAQEGDGKAIRDRLNKITGSVRKTAPVDGQGSGGSEERGRDAATVVRIGEVAG